MKHEHVIALLPAYLEHDATALTRRQRDQIAQHLQNCFGCTAALADLTDLRRTLHNGLPALGRPSQVQLRRMRQRVLAETYSPRHTRAQTIRRWSSVGLTLATSMSALLLAALIFSTPVSVNAAPPQSADRYMHTQTGQIAVRHTDTPIADGGSTTVLNLTPPAPINVALSDIRLTGNPAPSPAPSVIVRR